MNHTTATHWTLSESRRTALKLTLAGALTAGLAACGGGGGGGDGSDDSKDLRAAIDRLKAGMTYDDVVAAVGWAPNDGRNSWAHDGLLLLVSFRTPSGASVPLLETASLSGRGDSIDRFYQ